MAVNTNERAPITPKFIEFDYWFYRKADGKYDIIDISDRTVIGELWEDGEGVNLNLNDENTDVFDKVFCEFTKYNARPEYAVTHVTSEDDRRTYINMLVGVALIRAYKNGIDDPDKAYNKICATIDWLDKVGFFESPASSVYHDNYPGGLVNHSIKVATKIIELCALPTFKDKVNLEDAVLVALVHDWCKSGTYELSTRNAKNDVTGVWEKVPYYKKHAEPIPFGHGVTSMFYASRCFNLSVEECAAIRWHMGAWRVVSSEMDDLQSANEKYPLVHLLQFADQLSIVAY